MGNTEKKSKKKRKRKLSEGATSNKTPKNELQNGGTLGSEKVVSKKKKKMKSKKKV
jgi:hypothetical protein